MPTSAGGAKGAIGGAIAGVGVLAGAAAGTLFFLRKKRRSREQEEGAAGGLDGHDLARACDSVVVTKQKNRVKAAVHNTTQQGTAYAGLAAAACHNAFCTHTAPCLN